MNGILQIRPRWPHESEVMLTILSYQLLTELQHPSTKESHQNTCVLLVDIPHMEIYTSARSITNSSMNPSYSAGTHKVPTKPIEFWRFSMLHQFLWYVVTTNGQTFMHKDYVERSHVPVLTFAFRFSGLNFWPARRVNWCRESSSGASESIIYVRWL